MNFGRVEPTSRQQRFWNHVGQLLDEIVTDEVHNIIRETGDLAEDSVISALAAEGLLCPAWPVQDGGAGLDRVEERIFELELDRHRMPRVGGDMVWSTVVRFGVPDLVAELKPKVAAGTARFCLGYTEPDGGSDIAAAKVRAVQDGEDWIINGTKVFTTSAHKAQYVFLITRTDPTLPKHQGLTMFLVPLDTPGIEIHGIRTFGGERTNIVHYGDVRVPDRYRLGEVNDGWRVLRGPLDAEHEFRQQGDNLKEPSGRWFIRRSPLERSFDAVVQWARAAVRPDGTCLLDDPSVRMRLGRIAADIEWASCCEGPMGRVASADVVLRGSAELVDLVGPEALIAFGEPGALDEGAVDHAHRFAQGAATYGGTVEVFRQMIAQHMLGLPRPQYPGSIMLANKRRDSGTA
jgi:3-oxocholest-4-en-26-oyl-CoA dehydrogenase alpha subunit